MIDDEDRGTRLNGLIKRIKHMSDKNEELLLQTLLRTVCVPFKTYGSGEHLSSRKKRS